MRILVASSLDPQAIRCLQESHDVVCLFNGDDEQLRSLIHDREVLVFRSGVSVTREIMSCAPDLKLLVRAGCGLDNVDMGYVRHRNIQLQRIPEPAAKAVAEMTFGLMLCLARNIVRGDSLLRQAHWAKDKLSGHLLCGKVLGIVGTGNIGSRVGELGIALGMAVIGCVEFPSAAVAARLRAKGILLADFDDVISQADFLSIHVPLQASTKNLINASALARMKPGSFLVNLSRGGVVDEAALYRELVNGRLRGAALDVHNEEGEGKLSPLASLPNVVLTPHIGAMTLDTQREIGRRVVEIVEKFAHEPDMATRATAAR